jgi:hypothetical protein
MAVVLAHDFGNGAMVLFGQVVGSTPVDDYGQLGTDYIVVVSIAGIPSGLSFSGSPERACSLIASHLNTLAAFSTSVG